VSNGTIGSLYETITLLIILNKRKWISSEKLEEMKELGDYIGKYFQV
jgi:hypothetical protein